MFSRRVLTLVTTLHVIFVSLLIATTNYAVLTEAKMCVATEEDRYLCTDDAAKANAYRMKSGGGSPEDFFDIRDLGVEQTVSGTKEETDAVKRTLEKMKEYYLHEVIAKPEYNNVRHLW